MADVTQTVGAQADLLLTLVMDEGARLPEVARTIGDWDQADQAHYVVEWPIQEQRLRRLDEYAASDALTAAQRARDEQLQQLVTAHRPLLARILAP